MIETDTGGRKVGAVAALVQNLRNKSVDRGSDNMHCN